MPSTVIKPSLYIFLNPLDAGCVTLVKDILKTTLMYAAIGVALGLAVPYLGPLVGITGTALTELGAANSPAWLGLFFGAFGSLSAAVTPVFDAVFSNRSSPSAAPELSPELAVEQLQLATTPAIAHNPTKFRDLVDASRVPESPGQLTKM